VLTGEQARELLDSIDTSTLVGLRDRAVISVMTFAFARAVEGVRPAPGCLPFSRLPDRQNQCSQ
jgi:hypothetical protein